MSERPILFSAPMVRAILDGRKTQTRRIVKPQSQAGRSDSGDDTKLRIVSCPFENGMKLWVRETFAPVMVLDDDSIEYAYRADGHASPCDVADCCFGPVNWRPSIFMPRVASRITLEVTGVRVERLHDISDSDCMAEGLQSAVDHFSGKISGVTDASVRSCYRALWESINGPKSWSANPFVWCVEFRRI